MRSILVFGLLVTNTVFGVPITGPELINPSADEISHCVPETMQEAIHTGINNLPNVAKVTAQLYKALNGNFSKNCKMLAKYLEELDSEELLSYKNIAPKFSKADRHAIMAILNDSDTGLDNYLHILNNLDLHLVGYVSGLHGMLNHGGKLTVIDLIHIIDLIQRGALELQEFFQMLSYLTLAYSEIKGYSAILDGMHHQLSFKIIYMVNTLCTLTEDLRVSYLSLLDKGDCSDEQISHALGLNMKKVQAIADE